MSPAFTRPLIALFGVVVVAPTLATAQIVTKDPNLITSRTLVLPPPGAPPTGVAIDASQTWGKQAKVLWNAAAGATTYEVRRYLISDPNCCAVSSGPLPSTTTSWLDNGLLKYGNYMWTVYVTYGNGSVGSAGMGLTAGVRNPGPVTVTSTRAGAVKLSWDNNINMTSGAMVYGPGMGANGRMTTSGYIETGGLDPGTYTWTLASVYTNGLGVLSPPSEFTKATYTVNYGNGRFRISLEGFKALSTTAEDPFRNDGRGDEIFIATQVNYYWPNGELASMRMARTPTFGDVTNFPARVMAGSASSTGGIRQNDQYPPPIQYVSQLQTPTVNNLPYLLWEGELNEIKGVVFISPSIWESDMGDQLLPYYAMYQQTAAANLPYRNAFQPWVPFSLNTTHPLDNWYPQRCPTQLGEGAKPVSTLFNPPINNWLDEPIDMNQDHTYCPTFVPINYWVARSMTSVNPAMVVELPFSNAQTGWKYILYVRVERTR